MTNLLFLQDERISGDFILQQKSEKVN